MNNFVQCLAKTTLSHYMRLIDVDRRRSLLRQRAMSRGSPEFGCLRRRKAGHCGADIRSTDVISLPLTTDVLASAGRDDEEGRVFTRPFLLPSFLALGDSSLSVL
ncbi:hypothetical protein [Sinorhizobium americanum]|uniref:hypothetical protein n=1 Tax=Sinorhizobium americanum TaxID=194963 RepID=UPI0012EC148D|nr:hypothetical protein [Sinorhizobium americanum]